MFNFDFGSLLTLTNIFLLAFGSIFGMLVGAFPGLGATIGAAMLLPITFTMEPLPAILLLIALYQGAMYGGSISSIVIGIPGTGSAVATLFDGNALAKKGFPGKALGYSLYSSVTGGLIGVVLLMVFTKPMSNLAIKLSDPEMFLIGMLGLLSVITLGGGDVFKGYLSMTLGLFVGTMGVDLFTGTNRYTFGIMYMVDGVSLVALLAGLYAISETFNMVIGDLKKRYVTDTKNLRVSISLREYLNIKWTVLSSSLLGSLFGMVPGLGGGTASFLVYNFAKQRSKYPETFGKGNVHGIAAPEAANNAVVGGSLIPLLTLGIPGSPTCAVIASALIMQGIQPGPQVFGANPDLVYGIFWGLLLATIMMIVFGRYTTSIWAYLLVCPNYILVPIIVVASLIGAYSVRGFFIDVWIAIGVGIIAFFLRKIDFNMAAFILAFILAPLIEKSFRRSLMISRGSFVIFFNRPVAIILLVLIVAMIFFSIRKRMSAQTNKNKKELNFDV